MIPAVPSNFIGRDAEVREIGKWLMEKSPRWGMIHGGPGVGKTSLAIAIGHYIKDESNGNTDVVYCSREVDSVLKICSRILSHFCVPSLKESVAHQLYAYFSKIEHDVIIICDNIDDFLHDTQKRECFLELLENIVKYPHVKVLCTGREIFHLSSPDSKVKKLKHLREKHAVELLRSQCDLPDNVLNQFVAVCGRNPLGINLIGKLISSGDDPTRLLKKLQSPKKAFKAIRFPHTRKENDLDHLVRLSYERLDTKAKRLVDFLSVFPASFDLSDSCKLFQSSIDDMYDELTELVRSSILDYDTENLLYSMHPLIKMFAMAQRDLEGKEYTAKMFRKAGTRLAMNIAALECYETAISLARREQKNPTEMVSIFNEQFCILQELGKYQLLLDSAKSCFEYASKHNDEITEDSRLDSRYNLACAYHTVGQNEKAYELLTGLPTCSFEKDKDRAANYYWLLGELQRGKSLIKDALASFNKSKEFASNDSHHFPYIIICIAGIKRDQGDLSGSFKDLFQLQETRVNNRNTVSFIDALISREIGNNFYQKKEFEKALQNYCDALKIYTESMHLLDSPEVAGCLFNIGKSHVKLQQDNEALEAHRKALQIREASAGIHIDTVQSKVAIGRILSRDCQRKEALGMFKEGLSMMKDLDEQDEYIKTIYNSIINELKLMGNDKEASNMERELASRSSVHRAKDEKKTAKRTKTGSRNTNRKTCTLL